MVVRAVTALPPSLSDVHAVFHVSMLRKYTLDPTPVVDLGKLVVDTDKTLSAQSLP